jgi:hypothetical protein
MFDSYYYSISNTFKIYKDKDIPIQDSTAVAMRSIENFNKINESMSTINKSLIA